MNIIHDAQINSDRKKSGRSYSKETKVFALTVHYYSPRAYEYLREQFGLPSPRELGRWIRTVDAEPGFLDCVFKFKFIEDTIKGRPYLRDVALVFDAMSIRSHIFYDPSKDKTCGYVDMGGIVPDSKEAPATEALVFPIVSLTTKFKCPIAYLLCDKVNSSILSTIIISDAIEMLAECGVQVHSITCDGTNANN